jgi:hypothetical protein
MAAMAWFKMESLRMRVPSVILIDVITCKREIKICYNQASNSYYSTFTNGHLHARAWENVHVCREARL